MPELMPEQRLQPMNQNPATPYLPGTGIRLPRHQDTSPQPAGVPQPAAGPSASLAMATRSGPVFGHIPLGELDGNRLRNACVDGEPPGERIIISGQVLDEYIRRLPLRNVFLDKPADETP